MTAPIVGPRGNIRAVWIPSGPARLGGELSVPPGGTGVVLFARGIGSSRHSPRNQTVARVIRDAGIGTLLFDLLTPAEEAVEVRTAQHRFDIDLLARRLMDATRWIATEPGTEHRLDDSHLARYVAELGLDMDRFACEMTAHKYAGRVKQDAQSGIRSEVH